jgi:hypothetical protein
LFNYDFNDYILCAYCASILILTVDQALLDDYELGSQPMSIKKILAVAHYKERQEVGIPCVTIPSNCY